MYLFALAGVLFGTILFSLGIWLEFAKNHLPITRWAIFYVHRDDPMIIALDLAPVLFGMVGALIGSQRRLFTVLERSKHEWETIFDAISDPILVADENNHLLRCNHALVDRLNTTFTKVIGGRLADVLKTDQPLDRPLYAFHWLGRIYDVSIFPMDEEGVPKKTLIVFHDITDRKQAEATRAQTEALFRALLDLLPDAVVMIDPNDAAGMWPIIDCNEAACRMNGYERDELIGHSIDILKGTTGTPAERNAYLKQLREAGHIQLETQHRHKAGSVFPVELSTTLLNPLFDDDGLFGEEAPALASQGIIQASYQLIDFSNISPMDRQGALVHFDNDEKFMMDMCATFIESLPERLLEIQAALNQNSASMLGRLAHNLKGTCLNFSTEPLATLSAELETMGKREDLQFAPFVVEQMENEIHRLQEFVSNQQFV